DHVTQRFLPGLWLLWPDMKFLFSFRNGINAVHSRAAGEEVVPFPVRAAWQARYGTADFFEQCCREWAESVEQLKAHQGWLAERGGQVNETRLEQATTDSHELHRIWNWLVGYWEEYEERNRELMAKPVGARVNAAGVVSPERIWRAWTPEQRR